jgi:hypothetical protein
MTDRDGDEDEPRCPACDGVVDGDFDRVPTALAGETVRVPLDCPDCGASLFAYVGSDGVDLERR